MKTRRQMNSTSRQTTDTVHREIRVSDIQRGPGPIQPSALIAIADEVVLEQASRSLGGASVSALEIKADILNASSADLLIAESSVFHRRGPFSIWRTHLKEIDGTPVAQVIHTLITEGERIDVERIEPSAIPVRANRRSTSATIADERREIIAEAACNVIAHKGFAASSIREIADAAGMHVPTMYQYVSSKEEVLELVYQWVIRQVRKNVNDVFQSEAAPRDQLVAVTNKLVENTDAMRRHTGVLNRELRSLSKDARRRVIDDYAEIVGKIADVISAGIQIGEFRAVNPTIVANFIDAMCDMWALRQFAVGQFDIAEFRNEVVDFMEYGLSRKS